MPKQQSSKLLNFDLDSGAEDEPKGFQLNNDYAKRYEKWRSNEEMQKLKDRYGDVPDQEIESSDSESTSEEEWTTEHEKSFLTALSSLKGKDPKIYDGSKMFFKKSEDKSIEKSVEKSLETATKDRIKKQKDKPFLVKDHERKMITENRVDTESEGEYEPPRSPSYYEQQIQIKKDLNSVLSGYGDTNGDNSDLLKKRVKTEVEIEKEEDEYRKWLKGELTKLDGHEKEKEELKFLRDYWNDPKLDDGEQFLRDYVLQRKYLEEDDSKKDYIPTYDEVIHDSDENGLSGDEKEVEKMEKFENKFNFRFEEPDPEFIKKYPRTIEESYRRKETKRKEERIKAKERKQEEKDKKVGEIQQLKALKRKEVMDKLEILHRITGDSDLPFENVDLEGDFNPEEYDKRMNAIFNQEYYTEADDTKPVFPYDENIDGDQEDLEAWVPTDEDEDAEHMVRETTGKQKKKKAKISEETVASTSQQGSSKSAVKSELLEISKGRRMGKKKSIFLEALEKEKPKFDVSKHKSFEKYFEEYYKLDFEDLVGDIPCRFKYRTVVPNDFGLTTEEVLKAEDSELNQWASLKKTYQYRSVEEETYEVQAYSKKALNPKKKKQLLASIYTDRANDADDEDEKNVVPASITEGDTDAPQTKKSKKKKKKKKKTLVSSTAESHPAQKPDKKAPKRKVSKVTAQGIISEDRLRAYGINPTKYEKKRKYGK